jgi:hypothetical protein
LSHSTRSKYYVSYTDGSPALSSVGSPFTLSFTSGDSPRSRRSDPDDSPRPNRPDPPHRAGRPHVDLATKEVRAFTRKYKGKL